MHSNLRRVIPIVIIVIALLALSYWFFVLRLAQIENGKISASGTIEATQVQISPELGGRVLEVLVAKGDLVLADDVLVKLEPALLEAQRDQAAASVKVADANAKAAQANSEAAISQQTAAEAAQIAAQAAYDAAQANLNLLEAGATDEQLTAARAQVSQAQANYQAALASYAALTAGARPEDVSAAQTRLDEARTIYYELTVTLTNDQLEDLRAAVSQAESNLSDVEARHSDLEDDTRTPTAILDSLPGMLSDAQAALDAAQVALDAAENETMPFYLQVEFARQSLDLAELNVSQAKANQTALQDVDDITQAAKDVLQANVDDAQDFVDVAKTAYDGLVTSDQGTQLKTAWDESQRALADLNGLARGGTTPLETVLYQLDAATATTDAAVANLQNLENGARPEQITAAQAQVDSAQAQVDAADANLTTAQALVDAAQFQAEAALAQVEATQAALDALDVQIAKLTLTAPMDGVVLARSIEPGELAAPGAPLLTLVDLNRLTITVYVSEDRYGEVNLGQEATVTVDSFPDESFFAVVSHIADEAEFTPRNVQTADGRKTTVFAIELSIDNVDGNLKPGMPADVKFE